jgi:hypothetical protein
MVVRSICMGLVDYALSCASHAEGVHESLSNLSRMSRTELSLLNGLTASGRFQYRRVLVWCDA